MLYLTQVAASLFPGKDLADLGPEECLRIIQYVARARGTASRAVGIPEILCHILGHLSIKYREKVREVCVAWNSHAIHVRHPQEINLLVPRSEKTIHLGMVALDPEYIAHVRTQEEFDILWPILCDHSDKRYIPSPPRAEFVTPEIARTAFTMMTSTFGNLIWSRWILNLRYEAFTLLGEQLKELSIVPEIAGLELSRQSRAGTLDPRIIEDLYYRHRCQITDCFVDQWRHADSWQSPLAAVLSMCPELAIWNRLRRKWEFNGRDFIEIPTAVRIEAACSDIQHYPREHQFVLACRDWRRSTENE